MGVKGNRWSEMSGEIFLCFKEQLYEGINTGRKLCQIFVTAVNAKSLLKSL
jgi:hypothetical protein